MADGITLTHPDGPSITLTRDLSLTRSAGRPNSELRPRPNSDDPLYIDKVRSATDTFELSGAFLSGTPEQDAATLIEDILAPALGRASLTLTFTNGLWTLGTYSVVPAGQQAGRVSYSAGETGIVRVNALNLRVVDNS